MRFESSSSIEDPSGVFELSHHQDTRWCKYVPISRQPTEYSKTGECFEEFGGDAPQNMPLFPMTAEAECDLAEFIIKFLKLIFF